MNTEKPINKPLIIVSAAVVFFFAGYDESARPDYFSDSTALGIGVITVFVAPLVAIWIRALWNNLIPRFTGWRDISFLETLGLMAVAYLLTA